MDRRWLVVPAELGVSVGESMDLMSAQMNGHGKGDISPMGDVSCLFKVVHTHTYIHTDNIYLK